MIDGGTNPQDPPHPSFARVALLLLPAILSSLILAAHFLRFALLPLVLLALGMPLLLLAQRAWAVRVLQAWFSLGALLWISTGRGYVLLRIEQGRPWTRLLIIFASVVLLALCAVGFFELPPLKRALRKRS